MKMTYSNEALAEKRMDQRARRAAERVGLKAIKSRSGRGSVDNYGGYMIIDPARNWVVAGHRFEFSADEAIAFCMGD